MPPTPPESTSQSPQDPHPTSHAYRVVRKRNRVPLSCGPCRNRKLKCNRLAPCENCVRRNDIPSCTYATSTHSARHRKQSAGSTSSSSDEMQSRIDRLEGLVLSLMSGNSNNVSSPKSDARSSSLAAPLSRQGSRDGDADADEDDDDMGYDEPDELEAGIQPEPLNVEEDVEEVRNALGFMKVHCGKTFYRGETHWAALLSEITEVKKFFDETKQKYEDELEHMRCRNIVSKLQGTGFPFSASPPPSKNELLALVPKKRALVDMLIDTYFNNYDSIIHVLHRPSFFKQYEDFWHDPSSVDTLWLGLLMVMMSIAVKILNATDSNPPDSEIGKNPIESWHAFRCAAEQCMIVGEYTKKLYLHTVQTLILLVVSTTPLESSWFFLGSVVRIAMSMGLHRDPRQFPAITQGEGELRRRLWTMITCMDLLTSIQIGLPSMIKEDECDTKMPLNLHDDEVGANVKTLPPEHDKNVLTGVSYMISKASMAHGLCEIVRQVNSVKARPPYDEILKLEADLTARYEQMPEFLLTKSVEDNVNDPAWIIIQRHNLDVLRQIAYLSLHRPYAAKARSNPRYMYSYDRCVSAAMTLLQRQEELHRQIDSTHQQAKWFSISHDGLQFLHAAMIISLDLSSPQDVPPDAVDRKRKYDALYKARKVASNTMEWNIDASRAHGVITVLLNKLESTEPLAFQERVQKYAEHQKLSAFDRRVASYASTLPDFSLSPSSTQSSPIEPLKSDQAAALTLGMMSGGGLTPNSAFASLFSDRQPVSTPGGTFHLPDAPTGTVPPPAAFSPPGWNALWNMGSGPGGFDMPQGVEWDEWDEFMKGIDLDTSQMAGFPVMPGIGLYPASAAQDRLDKRDRGGGGSG